MGIEKFINNSYKLASSDNMAAYLDALKVPTQIKDGFLSSTPVVTLKGCGGNYTFQTRSSFRDRDVTFTPGVEFEDTDFSGNPIKCVMKVNGNKVTREVLSDPKTTMTSEISDDRITVTYNVGGVTATQVFKKV